MVTLAKGTVKVHNNDFTDQPYKPKKRLQVAPFPAMTPERMTHVQPVDPVPTWHILNEGEEKYYTR